MKTSVSQTKKANPKSGQELTPVARAVVGLAVLALCLGLGVWLLAATQGYLLRVHKVALLTLVALATGIPFWLLTPASSGDTILNVKRIGLQLAGAAAIGMSFMLLAWRLSAPPLQADVILNLPRNYAKSVARISDHSPSLVNAYLLPPAFDRVYVEFRLEEQTGWFKVRHLNENSTAFVDDTFEVNRAGRIREAKR